MRLFFVLLPVMVFFAHPVRAASDMEDVAGRILGKADGGTFDLPMLDSTLKVTIEGDMSTVEITQVFENPSLVPVEAEYLFPLNQNAAIYAMEMRVGDEIIQARIREKAKAQAEFEQAAVEGKSAALLTQHRPNMFTQRIANLMPGQPVTVVLRYVQMVPKIDDQYELVIPMIVGPRYDGTRLPDEFADLPDEDALQPANTWAVSKVPAYPLVAGLDVPDEVATDRVRLDLHFTSGVTASDFGSDTHPLTITQTEDGYSAQFAAGKVMDNRDLVLRYSLGGDVLEAATLSHTDERGGFISVMIEPPKVVDEDTAAPRELVFVLDTSGSMSGEPMSASKTFMDAALVGLRPGDYFRIIPFANTAQRFSNDALPATAANIRKARAYVRALSSGGGTEIDNAIRTAFSTRPVRDTMRIVVFLSDGYIGNEADVLRTIRNRIGSARIYAFGIGNSVNRYLLDAMADEGHGYARYVGVDEKAKEVARDLAADLKTPILTDIQIDWGELNVTGVTPSHLPDLFDGNSLRIYARHDGAGENTIHVKGVVQGRVAQMPVTIQTTGKPEHTALPLIWARNKISSLTRQVAVGENPDLANDEITKLGLEFSLQTQNTSFVAVSQTVVNSSGAAAEPVGVPLPMVSGVSKQAYPSGFSGSSSPEPETLLGLLLTAVMTLLGLRRRRTDELFLDTPIKRVKT
ncbi:VIT and vWA domain-containing protein [Actibacterium lipolyticum]|uniref:Vault protein inter-alpha-trypsin n=1 Tax=Actibacterium lipolyticum TaxID=1524263 RepID=A0A238KUU8_9RHOB|nr:VIT and VWA domain-containing protein [Actibacterium lipolyticum]SMX46565.1 Vault protein inter-alpha-trypsin [Actibacterium lipolyticum]